MSEEQQIQQRKRRRRNVLVLGGIGLLLCISLVANLTRRTEEVEVEVQVTVVVTQEVTRVVVATPIPDDITSEDEIEPVQQATQAPTQEPQRVTINCPECVADGDDIPLTLWETAASMGSGAGRVHHGDECFLLDQTVVDGIPKVRLRCPGVGTGWLRKEAISGG